MEGYIVFNKNPSKSEGALGGIFFSKETALEMAKTLKQQHPDWPVYLKPMIGIEEVTI